MPPRRGRSSIPRTTTKSTPVSRTLPPAIIDEILGNPVLSSSDLAQCCRISRPFLTSARSLLYDKVTIDSTFYLWTPYESEAWHYSYRNRAAELLRCISLYPHLGEMVKHLQVRQGGTLREEEDDVEFRQFSIRTKVWKLWKPIRDSEDEECRELGVPYVFECDLVRSEYLQSMFPNATRVTLKYVKMRRWLLQFKSVLPASCHRWTELDLDGLVLQEYFATELGESAFPNLERCRLSHLEGAPDAHADLLYLPPLLTHLDIDSSLAPSLSFPNATSSRLDTLRLPYFHHGIPDLTQLPSLRHLHLHGNPLPNHSSISHLTSLSSLTIELSHLLEPPHSSHLWTILTSLPRTLPRLNLKGEIPYAQITSLLEQNLFSSDLKQLGMTKLHESSFWIEEQEVVVKMCREKGIEVVWIGKASIDVFRK